MVRKVGTIRTQDREMVSMIGSYLAWRSNPKNKLPPLRVDENGACIYCDNAMSIVSHPEFGDMRCLCRIYQEQERLTSSLSLFRMPIPIKTIDGLEEYGTPQFSALLRATKKMVREWMEWPREWLTIAGSVGTGKTHILISIANYFGPWALYLTSGMLESMSYRFLNQNESMTLPEMIDLISNVPILLIDDVGSDYGSNFAMSTFRKIIDYRYLNYTEFPVVMGTNLMPDALRMYDQRLADRFLDKNIANYIELVGESYRKDNHGNS